jgi:phytoene dehydrogenase-like protein
MIKKFDAIVVGGGHNGLVAACYLAIAGRKVAVIERNAEFGGATSSVYAFPGINARLSRYSYLVALLPDEIISDLSLNFSTLSRKVSSYTPVDETGIIINRNFDETSRNSIDSYTRNTTESESWQNFYSRVEEFARKVAPTMLRPLPTEEEIRNLVGEDLWRELIAEPLSKTLDKYFKDDLVKGIVLTDGLIGTFTSANSRAANICFLYHLIGNGSGEWKVPIGGMGKLVTELLNRANQLGVTLMSGIEITEILEDQGKVLVRTKNEEFESEVLLAACSRHELARLMGSSPPSALDGSQVKMNMVLKKLPRLKSGVDPRIAFSGTFHIDESFSQLEKAYLEAKSGEIPTVVPAEMYCHTLTDRSILDGELAKTEMQTLTVFVLHTPASLFDHNHDSVKAEVARRVLTQLNRYLIDPIESCIALDANGQPCLEIKSPQELEKEIALPRGNIFHGDLEFPWKTKDDSRKWGAETNSPRIFIAGAGATRGGGVSGIAGQNAAKAALERIEKLN